MALSDDDQRSLNELETFNRSADPGFAASLGRVAAERWRHRQVVIAWTASLLGIFAMLAGLGAAQGLISIGTIVLGYGLLLTVWGVVGSIRILKMNHGDAGRSQERH